MRKKWMAALAAGILSLSLTGCGENQIPELTSEELQLVGEYTAMTMMKYDANQRSRLVDYTAMLATPEPEVTSTPEPQKPEEKEPVDSTPVIGPAGGTPEPAPTYTMEEVLELPEGISLVYSGVELYDKYPDGDIGSLGMTANTGKKLLVLSFLVANTGSQDQEIDLLHLQPEFKITVNGNYTRRALVTVFENDLATYLGTIPAGGNTGTVLVIEVDGNVEGNLSSLSINLKNDSKACTIQLLQAEISQ